MSFIEIIVTVKLKQDMHYEDCGYIIGKNINKSMLLDPVLKKMHPDKEYKNYVFNGFYPIEREKIYKEDRAYIFRIRGIDEDIMSRLSDCMWNLRCNEFEVISVAGRYIEHSNMKYLFTQTPVIITVDDRPWLQQSGDIDLFIRRLEDNLEKKYKDYYNEDIDLQGNFVESIEFRNRVPMCYRYKGIKLLANKIKVNIKDNEDAQKAVTLARAVGLGEKNSSVGAGFCE